MARSEFIQKFHLRNWTLNIGIVIALILAALLVYALFSRFITPRVDPNRVSNPLNLMTQKITVEVRNATKQDGIAGTVRNYLFERGFDVVESGNAPENQRNEAYTMVYDRAGEIAHARMIANVLGIPDSRIEQKIRTSDLVDVSIVIGKDFPALKPFKQ